MKQNLGVIATVTVLLGLIGFSSLPKSASDGTRTATESKTKTKPPGRRSATSAPQVACKEIAGRIHSLVQTLSANESPDSCFDDGNKPKLRKTVSLGDGVSVVIATVPNPISTHLPLMFDRLIEAIQQAAEDDDYSYDSSWFPWNESSKDYTFLEDQLNAEGAQEIQQEQPGVMVFRRALRHPDDESPYTGGLIVFVVGEQPTQGIDSTQFENAVAWIRQLGALTPKRGLKILGPTFSGSLPSLAKALSVDGLSPLKFQVSSGSVSSELSYSWFQKSLGSRLDLFQTAMGGDSLMVRRFCQYLVSEGYTLDRVAMVSEDETAFGSTLAHSGRAGDPVYLYYPRDIATLRSAYEQQSILNSSKQQSGSTGGSTTLRGDLSEPSGSEHDTVRSYGGQLTPLAQESVLLNIVRVLKEKKIEYVVLRSTNSLDQIFLTQFLRRSLPGARVVIDGADLLFERGSEGSSLRGVMIISSYPLLTDQQDWTRPMRADNSGSYRIFGEDVAEGLYVAARELLRDPSRTPSLEIPIGNYGEPAWALPEGDTGINQRPSTWLSVIGRRQFWPLAVLNEQTLPDTGKGKDGTETKQGPEMPPTASQRGETPAPRNGDRRPLRIDGELLVMLILCSIWSLLHCVWCWRASVTPFPDAFRMAQFAPIRAWQQPVLIALSSALPAMAAVVTASASGAFSTGFLFYRAATLILWSLAIIAASVLACAKNYTLRCVVGSNDNADCFQIWRRTCATIGLISFAFFVLLHAFLISQLKASNRIPAYWRSVHLFSGVSPLLPQMLLIIGAYLWAWFSLRGLGLFGDDRPQLPEMASLPALRPEDGKIYGPGSATPMFSQERAAWPIENAAKPLGKLYLKLFVVVLLVAFGFFALILGGFFLRTLGERAFGFVIFFWLTVCIALVLTDTVQLWLLWSKLRPLLVYLDRLPLRRTLASLGGLSWGSVWAMSGNTLEERYRLTSRQMESLRHLTNQLAPFRSTASASAVGICTTLTKIDSFMTKEREKFVNWYLSLDKDTKDKEEKYVSSVAPLYDFQKALAGIAGSVFSNVLIPAWQMETRSLILKTSPHLTDENEDAPKPEAGKKDVTKPETGEVPQHILAAEEFFLLPYIGFIQNVLGRMRTIILGSLFLFVAATVAASSYPFDPLPTVGGIFLSVFLITGGTIVIVFAQMHRDATLSHVTSTLPGQLGGQFWLHLVTFGVGPLLGLLTTLFPSITDFVSSWLQPGMQALK